MKKYLFCFLSIFTIYTSCAVKNSDDSDIVKEEIIPTLNSDIDMASVDQVTTSGSSNNYSFSVTISSPDTGCDQYADWWEVISEDGDLLYRRILAHSHVNEQPFTRSGSGVTISPDQQVWVRLHMNNTGYSTQVMKGSVSEGFVKAELPVTFASNLETEEPLPSGCAF